MAASYPTEVPSIDVATEGHRPATSPYRGPRRWPDDRPTTPGSYLFFERPRGGVVLLQDEVVHVGRGLSCDVRLDDHHVSRRQAILLRRARGHRLLADRSADGMLVNGRRVEQADLRDGDVIVLGRSVLRYVVVG